MGKYIKCQNDFNLTPFKCWSLENFPFIEKDFDSMTEYQILCKIIDKLNLHSQAIVDLQHYFENLNVQDEINQKLDEMVASGELDNILYDYTNVTKVYNTFIDVKKSAESLINNQKIKTLGYNKIGDNGEGIYYITNTIDSSNYQETLSEDLYATLISDGEIKIEQLGAVGDGVTDDSDIFEKAMSLKQNIVLTKQYKITRTINIPEHKVLIGKHGSMVTSTVGNSPIFTFQSYAKIYGFKILTSTTFTSDVFKSKEASWYDYFGTVYADIHDIKVVGNMPGEVSTGNLIHLYAEGDGFNFCMYNKFYNIVSEWIGCAFKFDTKQTGDTAPWITANTVSDCRVWHNPVVADLDKNCSGNMIKGIVSQGSPYYTETYICDGMNNTFNDLVYYDLALTCNMVHFGPNSQANQFNLWVNPRDAVPLKWKNEGNDNYIGNVEGLSDKWIPIELNTVLFEPTSLAPSYRYQNGQIVFSGGFKLKEGQKIVANLTTIGKMKTTYTPYPTKTYKVTPLPINKSNTTLAIYFDGTVQLCFADSEFKSLELDGISYARQLPKE